jgi:hypothetical protein
MQVEAVHGRLSSKVGVGVKRRGMSRSGLAMPGSRTLMACFRFFVQGVNGMAEYDVYRRGGVQSNGQHAYL